MIFPPPVHMGAKKLDTDFASVVLLMHFNGNLVDEIGNATSGTGVTFSDGKFGSGGVFDGSARASVTDSTAFNMPGDFTIELWARTSVSGTSSTLFSTNIGIGLQWNYNLAIGLQTSGAPYAIVFRAGSHDILASSTNIADDGWHHIALVRSGGTITLYLDGVAQASASYGLDTLLPHGVTLGAAYEADPGPYVGRLDDLRFTVGVARYTANFVPPAAPFPDA